MGKVLYWWAQSTDLRLAGISGCEVQGPYMGRLADGHPMQREETLVKRLSHTFKYLYLSMCVV